MLGSASSMAVALGVGGRKNDSNDLFFTYACIDSNILNDLFVEWITKFEY